MLGIRPGIAAQVADFEACSVAFGDLGIFSAHSLPSGSGFFGKSIRRRASGQSAVFTLRKLEAQFSLQRLYLLREDGGWISVVLGCKVLHPVGLFLEISLIGTLIEGGGTSGC